MVSNDGILLKLNIFILIYTILFICLIFFYGKRGRRDEKNENYGW